MENFSSKFVLLTMKVILYHLLGCGYIFYEKCNRINDNNKVIRKMKETIKLGLNRGFRRSKNFFTSVQVDV